MRSAIFAVCVALGVNVGNGAELKPLEVETHFKACAEASTIKSVKGACYIYDIQTNQHYVEVYVGAGLNWSPNTGTVLLGATFNGLLEVVIKFPVGHPKKEMEKAVYKEIDRVLKSKELKQKLAEFNNKPFKIEKVKEVKYCTEDDPLGKLFKKAKPYEGDDS